MAEPHYVKPSLWTNLFNRLPMLLARLGFDVMGIRTLAVRGRNSGEWRTVPVNLLERSGERYLVAPRGETQWVRNLRAAGGGELRLGRRSEAFRAIELDDEDKPELLRAYLERWGFEVNAFFGGVTHASPASELRRVAPLHPVFRIGPA